ncbi:MAG: DUF4326 domain-containing protein [Blastocatellia bacterium]
MNCNSVNIGGVSAIVCGRGYRQPKGSCECKEKSVHLFLCDHVLDNSLSSYQLCSKKLCNTCSVRWYGGADYCKDHLPTSNKGKIVLANVSEQREQDIYIGSNVGLAGYGASILAGRGILAKKLLGNKDHHESELTLKSYKVWLWSEIKKKQEVYLKLIEIRNLLIRGEDVSMVCWCPPNPCHGQIIKSCIENYMIPQFLA